MAPSSEDRREKAHNPTGAEETTTPAGHIAETGQRLGWMKPGIREHVKNLIARIERLKQQEYPRPPETLSTEYIKRLSSASDEELLEAAARYPDLPRRLETIILPENRQIPPPDPVLSAAIKDIIQRMLPAILSPLLAEKGIDPSHIDSVIAVFNTIREKEPGLYADEAAIKAVTGYTTNVETPASTPTPWSLIENAKPYSST